MTTTTPGLRITGVDFIAIPAADFDESVRFYGEVLGLPEVKRWGRAPGVEFQAGNLTIAVMQSDAFGQEFNRGSTLIAFQVADVAATRGRLEQAGVEFHAAFDSGVCHQAHFHDPDGNPLLLHQRYAPTP